MPFDNKSQKQTITYKKLFKMQSFLGICFWKWLIRLTTRSLLRVTLIDFTLSNARRFYSLMGASSGMNGLSTHQIKFEVLVGEIAILTASQYDWYI